MYEDIEWIVVDVTDENVILLSKYIIDAGCYPNYQWFNTFVNTSFSGEGAAYVEKASFLDYNDAEDYLSGKSYADTKPTEYALSKSSYTKSWEYGYGWWLSDGFSDNYKVLGSNNIDTYYSQDAKEVFGYRPSIAIKIIDENISVE